MVLRVTTTVTFPSASGVLRLGQNVTFHVGVNKPVTVTGVPTLITTDGGVAFYVATSSNPLDLAFVYTVGLEDSSSNLTIAGLTTNGGSIHSIASLAFASPTIFATGDQPRDIVSADLNFDGKDDLVVSNYGDNDVSVMLTRFNPLTGLKVARVDYNAGTRPNAVAVGDFLASSGIDILATNPQSGTLALLRGEDNGVFEVAGPVAVNEGANSVTSIDLDRDGRPDLIITLPNKKLLVEYGTGEGSFIDADVYGVGAFPVASAVADFNGDRRSDIVVVNQNSNSISTLLAVSAREFTNSNNYRVGAAPKDVVAVDVNKDGKIDLVVTNSLDDTVMVLLGDGEGGFAPGVTYMATDNPGALAAADMDGDGNIDLVVVSDAGVSVLQGNGDGTFRLPETVDDSSGGRALTLGDFNGDGRPDIAVTNPDDDSVTVLMNQSQVEESLLLPSILVTPGAITGYVIDGRVPKVEERLSGSGSFGAGATIEVILRFSETVLVVGTPQLSLNSGGTATYVSGSNSTDLVFRTTIAAGQNALGLRATELTLPSGAHITNVHGNEAALDDAAGTFSGRIIVDTTRPLFVGDTTTPESGRYGAGQVLTVTLNSNEVLFVTGTPTLSLSNGGTATYVSGSGTHQLNFAYTIGTGQDTSSLAVLGVSLPSASTIRDAAGNDANLAGASDTLTGLVIDTTTPVVLTLATSPASGILDVGQVVDITMTMSEAVTVQGTPVLQLNDGGTATYVGGDGTTNLQFRTTIAAGQNAATLAVTGVTLPTGASIHAVAGIGTEAYLGSATRTFASVSVNTAAPVVRALVSAPADATFNAGATVTLTLEMSKVVAVSGGVPTLTLDDGAVAHYVSGSGTTRLVFTSVVAPGQVTQDLAVTALHLNGAVITDAAGRAADLTGAVGNPAGTLTIDAAAVTVSEFTVTASAAGPLGIGQQVTLNAALDRDVSVDMTAGAPTLTLNDGGTASYDAAASTPTMLVFHHTIAAGQNAANLAVTGMTLNSASIHVVDGPLSLGVTTGYAVDALDVTKATIADLDGDGVADVVVASLDHLSILLGDGAGGFYTQLTYAPRLSLFGPTGPAAVADINGDGHADVVVGSDRGAIVVALGDGTGNLGTPTFLRPRVAGDPITYQPYAVAVADLNRDGSPDIVASSDGYFFVWLGDGNGGFATPTRFATGNSPIAFNVADMDGDGLLDLVGAGPSMAGGAGRVVVLHGDGTGGFGAPALALTGRGDYLNALTVADLNGDGRQDVVAVEFSGNSLSYALADGSGGFGPSTTLAAGVEPTGVAAVDVNGDGKLDLVVSNTRGGDLQVFLGDGSGGFATPVGFEAGAGPIQRLASLATGDLNGDGRPDFVVPEWFSGRTFVVLNNTTPPNVFDPAGATGAAGHATGLVVDTTAPTILADTANPGQGVYDIGQAITLTLHGSEALIVAGTPALILNNGAIATYVGGSGSTDLQFRTIVAAGRDTAALAVTGASLAGGATIRDAAGNDADLAGVPASFTGLSIVTTPPSVRSVAASPADGTLDAGAVITLQVVLDKIVAVARGVPTLTLNDGGTATYVSGSGTDTLVFTSTVLTGQATADLAVSAVNLNGARVVDRGGQAADLSGAVTNPAGTLAVSAPQVGILDILAAPYAPALPGAGGTATLTAEVARGVAVSGTPLLALNDGGIATYDPHASTPTRLVFQHTVLPGQVNPDLGVSAFRLNGASITVLGALAFATPVAVPAGSTDFAPSNPGIYIDLDRDLLPDQITVHPGAGTVSVTLFDGINNRMLPAVDYAVGLDPVSVIRADLNADNIGDMLVANAGSGTVSVLLGTGPSGIADGGFAAAHDFALNGTNSTPRSVTFTDANADGRTDLLVASGTSVYLLLGDGAGGFTDAGNGAPTTAAMVADVTEDGRPDAVVTVAGIDKVMVLPGIAGGGFGPAMMLDVGPFPDAVAVADVNGDGIKDLVVANQAAGTLSLVLGTGAGSFAAATTLALSVATVAPRTVTMADANGDGNVDILVGYSDAVDIRLGDGAGGFGGANRYVMGLGPTSIVLADLNGDGRLDLVASFAGDSGADPGGVTIRLGSAGGGFGTAVTLTAGAVPQALVVADLNGDGAQDIIVANALGGISVLAGNGLGGFAPAANFAAGVAPMALAAADLNGDGRLDLAVADGFHQVNVLLGNGNGGFGGPTSFVTGNSELVSISALDLNGDGRPDLVATDAAGTVFTLLNQSGAPGTFTPPGVAAPGAAVTLTGTNGNDTIMSGPGGLSAGVTGGPVDNSGDSIIGLGGDDLLRGGAGADVIAGGLGNDTFLGSLGNDSIVTGGGHDVLDYSGLVGTVAINLLTGRVAKSAGGTDTVAGSVGLVVTGGGGDSITGAVPAGDADAFGYMRGMGGDDTIAAPTAGTHAAADYAADPDGILANLATGTATDGWGGHDLLFNVQAVRGSAFADRVTGSSGSDTFDGGGGNDSFIGGGGADLFMLHATRAQATLNHLGGTEWAVTTSAGTARLSGVSSIQFDDTTVVLPTVGGPASDFDGDGRSDLLFHNDDGTLYQWQMAGISLRAQGTSGQVSSDWQVAETADFNGDGRADILWRHTSGAYYLWTMDGLARIAGNDIASPGGSWQVTALGDFNGDGKADLLWRNADGALYMWEMDGATLLAGHDFGTIGTQWQVRATGDFNGDGRSDLLWRNGTTGDVYVWEMNSGAIVAQRSVGNASADWRLVGTGDFGGDGKSDIFWQNTTTGQLYEWQMNDLVISAQGSLGNPGATWQVSKLVDLNGDRKSDLVLTDGGGDVWAMLLDGLQVTTTASIGHAGTAWHLV